MHESQPLTPSEEKYAKEARDLINKKKTDPQIIRFTEDIFENSKEDFVRLSRNLNVEKFTLKLFPLLASTQPPDLDKLWTWKSSKMDDKNRNYCKQRLLWLFKRVYGFTTEPFPNEIPPKYPSAGVKFDVMMRVLSKIEEDMKKRDCADEDSESVTSEDSGDLCDALVNIEGLSGKVKDLEGRVDELEKDKNQDSHIPKRKKTCNQNATNIGTSMILSQELREELKAFFPTGDNSDIEFCCNPQPREGMYTLQVEEKMSFEETHEGKTEDKTQLQVCKKMRKNVEEYYELPSECTSGDSTKSQLKHVEARIKKLLSDGASSCLSPSSCPFSPLSFERREVHISPEQRKIKNTCVRIGQKCDNISMMCNIIVPCSSPVVKAFGMGANTLGDLLAKNGYKITLRVEAWKVVSKEEGKTFDEAAKNLLGSKQSNEYGDQEVDMGEDYDSMTFDPSCLEPVS